MKKAKDTEKSQKLQIWPQPSQTSNTAKNSKE